MAGEGQVKGDCVFNKKKMLHPIETPVIVIKREESQEDKKQSQIRSKPKRETI